MNRPLQVGITGGIGSGKSLVCRIFQCLGISIYDADSRAKSLMTTDGILIAQIRKEFGDLSYNEDGSVNRKYLSEVVFNKSDQLEKLNSLVHPRVGEDYKQWLKLNAQAPYVVKEAALLIEAGTYRAMDYLIVVQAPEALRVQRVLKRDTHRTTQDVLAIIRNQLQDEERLRFATDVIVNDETRLLIPQVLMLHEKFSARQNK
ncbi:MAG: dephospho-CoA kinase [Cyclobacteriaceae bacterium]|nr:dephospho-CoA kinase [Cyclobacteriaceae bacterium]